MDRQVSVIRAERQRETGNRSYRRESVHAQQLTAGGQAPPIAGGEVVVQPGETLTLNGIENVSFLSHGTAEDSACSGAFRSGQKDFVLDAEDAVKEGAVLLSSTHALSAEACRLACCQDARCNVALMEPRRSAAADAHTCVLFDCVHRNRFVCRFVNQVGYLSYILGSVYAQHLAGPQAAGGQAPPIAIAGRDVVVQPGETLTLNGIESLPLDDAHISTYSWKQKDGAAGVTMEQTDLPDQVRLSNLQPGSYVFQLTVTDSNDQSDDAEVTVLVLDPEQSSKYCRAPVKVGPCRAAFPRWRYDAATGDCVQFVFGGCKSNNNNFLSKAECLSACKGVKVTSERAVPLPAAEVCGSACLPGQLVCGGGCCLDRSLECDGTAQCSDGSDENHCSKLNQTFSRLLSIDVNQRKARCAEPPRTGPCRASHTRWYYDPLNRKCLRFTFGGCDGNDNNFETIEKCSETCDGVTERHVFSRGMFERFEEEEDDDDSGSIALAVVLSVAILALLAILTYCFLKSRRERSHRPVATATLPEHDTLVYNSTTKPV
ncbi:kunitz-type protease inhibitor 1-like [Scomber japonicus]|uniref:kunitz-type protease inhibitor 1-like n=1 Tax=Scomber japonicus TaxID=13676 RepID=UPI002306C82A|nr:kunitz-type protease inhibitor 1-like [Scomber japonicus]